MARRKFVREKKIYCGKEWLEVDIVAVTNIPEKGRGKKNRTQEKQQKANDRRSRRKFLQIANTNFSEEDYHVSATYDKKNEPKTLEEAERVVHNYLNRVKRRMAKKGIQLKYMLVTEYTPDGEEGGESKRTKAVRIHHHILINGGLSRDELEMMWTKERINWRKAEKDSKYCRSIKKMGFVNCDRIQVNENGVEGLVNYINKRKQGCKKWSTSQNMQKPKKRKNDHKYSFRKVRELAKTPEDKEVWRRQYPGYEPTKIEFVFNDYTGWSIYLRLRKNDGREEQ